MQILRFAKLARRNAVLPRAVLRAANLRTFVAPNKKRKPKYDKGMETNHAFLDRHRNSAAVRYRH